MLNARGYLVTMGEESVAAATLEIRARPSGRNMLVASAQSLHTEELSRKSGRSWSSACLLPSATIGQHRYYHILLPPPGYDGAMMVGKFCSLKLWMHCLAVVRT